MKTLLLSITFILLSFLVTAQAPANDSVENAIEITTNAFTDENLRLDLAPELNESINGCDINGFKTVFYKFTAPFNGDASAVILNQDGSSATGTSIFAIFYSAPNLNITSADEFIFSETPCYLTPIATNLIITQGQSYYIAISRSEANVISKVEVNFEEIPVPENDLLINATEIVGDNFVDSNIRLDHATASPGGQVGCETTQEVVYYKYTATQDAFVSLYLTNNSGSNYEIGTSSFIRAFEAPSLNITSETDLILASNQICNSERNIDIEVVSGQSYYFLVHRPDQFETTTVNFELVVLQNDSIINATEITTSSFTESNLRLDLASESSGGQNGCSTTEKVLYYKFTANSGSKLFTKLIDDTYNPITGSGSTFIFIYEAPNLNVTSESELTLAPGVNCDIQYGGNIDLINGQSYYILINRDREFAKTTFSFEIDVPQIERQALIDFYNSTGGNFWWFGDNWNDDNEPIKYWEGVFVNNGHVTDIGLTYDGLFGEIPESITNLTFLESIVLSRNNLSGTLPDFSGLTNLWRINIENNLFSFADLETNYVANSSIEEFQISPQKLIDDYISIVDPTIGETFEFSMTPQEGTDLTYQWVKKTTLINEDFISDVEDVPGANTPIFTIPSYQEEDASTYTCQVTSPIVTDLIIERNPIKFRIPVSQSERDALITLYNATDGDNWYLNNNWLSEYNVDFWQGVETFGGKVVSLNLNGHALNGELPEEIGDLVHLKELILTTNPNLSGSIPETFQNFQDLEWLSIVRTDISGEIPSFLGNLTSLKYLTLDENLFTGEVPSNLGNLSNLILLRLAENDLTGTLPSELNNLTSLLYLELYDNNFSGPLPEWNSFVNPEDVSINIRNNFYSFSDLEPLINNGIEYGSLIYSPQNTLDDEEELTSPPGVDITLDVNDTDINRNAQDPSPNNVYQWFKDGEIIDGAITNPYTIINAQPSDSGIYHCEITNPLVPDLTIVRADITVTVEDNLNVENFENEDFKLYPNPASNWLSIKTNSLSDAKAQVFDINGKLLFETTLTSKITAIAVDQLSAGMYLISVTTDNEQSTKRFIKQ